MKQIKYLLSFFSILTSLMLYGDDFNATLQKAEQGNAVAQNKLGDIYEAGEKVPVNYTQAIYWYEKAAKQGNSDAQYNLGYMYYNGYGIKKDYAQAVIWFQKSAKAGNAVAQCSLGLCYKYGDGIQLNYPLAMYWLKKSIKGGFSEAQKPYQELVQKGYREAKNDIPIESTISIQSSQIQPPLLSFIDNTLIIIDGSRNNIIDANERSTIIFKIKNIGNGPAYNCKTKIKMSGASSGISISQTELPTIDAGQSYEVKIPIATDINTQDGNVTFSIEVYEPNGFGIAPFDIAVATKAYDPPLLQVVDYNIASNSGKIRKMEPFTLNFNLQNTKYGDAEDVKVKINLPSNIFIVEGEKELSIPRISSGEVVNIQLALLANNNYSSTDIPVSININEKYGKYAENKKLDIALDQTTHSTINIAAKEEPQTERKEIQLAMITSAVDRNIPVTEAKNPNTFVLIIANEHYLQVASVPFALNDGNIFREYCIKTLGIGEKHIKYLSDATGNQIKAGVNWLANLSEAFDEPQIIVYYAGHGIPDEANKSAYLLPVDGSGTDVTTGYKLDDLYKTLGNMPASHITIFMDACFSGSKREEGMLASARGVALKAKSGVPQGNMVVFSAAQGDETAYPNREQQHGLFTYYLLKKLQETEGDVSLKELGDYVTKQVSQQSLLLNSKKQTPCVTPSASLGTEWQSWKLK